MTASSNRPYQVVYSGNRRQIIRAYGAQAAVRGFGPAYRAAVKSIHHHLEMDPLEWGDPHNRLPHSGLILYHGMLSPLHVFYAVDPERRIVFVRDIKHLPHQRLHDV